MRDMAARLAGKFVALLIAGCMSLQTVGLALVWADEFEAKEDLTVSGTGGTLKNPNAEVKGNAAFTKDVYIHDGSLSSPFGGVGRYENMAVQSEDLSTTWTASSVTVTADQENGPNGSTSTADQVAFGATATNKLTQTATLSANTDYALSVWAKSASGTPAFRFVLNNGTADTFSSDQTVSTSWKRFGVIINSGTLGVGAKSFGLANASSGTNTVRFWGFQAEPSSVPGVYVRTAASAVSLPPTRRISSGPAANSARGYVWRSVSIAVFAAASSAAFTRCSV